MSRKNKFGADSLCANSAQLHWGLQEFPGDADDFGEGSKRSFEGEDWPMESADR